MAGPRSCPSTLLLALLWAGAARAADTCECPDIADLRNREAESRAAIQAYRNAIVAWAGAPPAANEPARKSFQQSQIQPAIDGVTTSGTNKATGETDPLCHTTIDETSACMKEVTAQHEFTHSSACHAHQQAHPTSLARWSTLADYALEEIAAYQAEAAYVHGALSNLTRKCQLQIEMVSEIAGGMETTLSKATGNVLATFTAPDHQPTTPYKGSGQLRYETRDIGPPKKVGDKTLMKLIPVCYAASVGSGTTPFNVLDGYLWRGNVPPYEPRLDLVFEIHPTGETRYLKGERGCPKSKTPQAFWSDWFLRDKTTPTALNHVLIDAWTFDPKPGVLAEKVLNGSCGMPVALPGKFAAYGPLAPCAEKTTFTVRLKSP
jgi:hypothetical protein